MTYENRIALIAAECTLHQVPYTLNECWEGWQIRFPWCKGDIAAHDGTYGARGDMVESYEFPWDNGDASVLTPKEAAERVIDYWNNYRQKMVEDAWRAIGF